MKLTPFVIETMAKLSIGRSLFDEALRIASTLEDQDLSNDEKRKRAVSHLRRMGFTLQSFALKLAVALAVAWMQSKKLPVE